MVRVTVNLSCTWIVRLSSFVLVAVLALPLLWAQVRPQDPTSSSRCGPSPATALPGPSTQAIGNSYALIIGIADYVNLPATAQLDYPGRDATGMYLTLTGLKGEQFPPRNVHLLMNEHATLANIRHELEEWLPSVAKDGDRVLIYFSGHSFIARQTAYLAPYDVDVHNVLTTAYPTESLGTAIGGKIHAKWKILIMDAVHSGAIVPLSEPATLTSTLNSLTPSVFTLTSATDRGDSFESEGYGGGHGVFTYYVMEGLNGAADYNFDGVVTADELSYYVHTKVRQATDGRGNPTSERGSFDPQMVLASDPSRADKGDTPSTTGSLTLTVNKDQTEVFLDGQPAGRIAKEKPLYLTKLTPGIHIVSIPPSPGQREWKNEEQVYAGVDTEVMISRLPLPSPAFAKSSNRAAPISRSSHYALVIGISSYENLPPEGQLKFADKDALAMYDTLTDPLIGQFAPANVHTLINRKATRANIRREIEDWLPSVSRDDSEILIYFAGHGVVAGGLGYFAPYDVKLQNIVASSYPMETLGLILNGQIKGANKILITDACHAGALNPERNQLQLNHNLLDLKNSLVSLTASRDREQSFESERWGGGHGVFTYYVVKGLRGEADSNGDGLITADELAEYVRFNVRDATAEQQNPTNERGSYDPNLVLSNLLGSTPQPNPTSGP